VSGDVKVNVMDWSAAIDHARPIRVAVFVEEQGVPIELEWDERDAISDHALAIDPAGRPLATGRLLPDGHIGRMAVLREARGRGIGGAVLRALMTRARTRGMATLRLNAQTHAAAFYARHGFRIIGPEFEEAGIPHVVMQFDFAAGAADSAA
jgi:predicted GNAT family N-acyltransferase